MSLSKNYGLIIFGLTLTSMSGMIETNQLLLLAPMFENPNTQSVFAISGNGTSDSRGSSINNTSGKYISANNTEDWIDPENNLKIHFTYLPEYPLAGNTTQLIFHIQNLQNGSHLKDLIASVTIINNLTTAKIDGVKDTNGEFSKFTNIEAPNGVFSLNYRFFEEGRHQVIVNIHSKNFSLALSSFNVFVQPVV